MVRELTGMTSSTPRPQSGGPTFNVSDIVPQPPPMLGTTAARGLSSTSLMGYNSVATTPVITTTARFATAADFHELIAQEAYIDYDRLRFLAFHGIPSSSDDHASSSLRGTVWKLLIPKMLTEFDFHSQQADEDDFAFPTARSSAAGTSYSEMTKLIRDALDHYLPEEPFFRRSGIRSKMEKGALQYLTNHPSTFATRDPKLLVYLYGPFLYVTRGRSEAAEHMFSIFMEMLEHHNSPMAIETSFRKFMTMFRAQFSSLCAHFEDEELDARKWVTAWHQGLFAKQLPFRLLLRLWDSYFSASKPVSQEFDLHRYVCLAVLKAFENDLLDKPYPELRAFMQMIPGASGLDIEKIVAQAQSYRTLD